jgi:hypothetical protein
MGENVTGKRQHIVPQQMIRNFAGSDGKLIELIKPTLKIATRRRSPKSILFRDDVYRDSVSDFDAELLTPVEQKFAQVYPRVLERATLNGDEGAALVDWIAAMLVRTQLITGLMPLAPSDLPADLPPQLKDRVAEAKKLLDNMTRSNLFTMYQDLLARQRWRWKFRKFPIPCLALSDHPVGITSIHQEGGQMVIVPMSSKVVLIGGARDAIERMRDAIAMDYNFFAAAYAHRSVFACERPILEEVVGSLSDTSPFPPERVRAARQPFFGAPHRIRERMKSETMPQDFDPGAALQKHIESFGPPVWEAES